MRTDANELARPVVIGGPDLRREAGCRGRVPDRPHGGGEPVRHPDAGAVLREVMAVAADDEATLAVVNWPRSGDKKSDLSSRLLTCYRGLLRWPTLSLA